MLNEIKLLTPRTRPRPFMLASRLRPEPKFRPRRQNRDLQYAVETAPNVERSHCRHSLRLYPRLNGEADVYTINIYTYPCVHDPREAHRRLLQLYTGAAVRAAVSADSRLVLAATRVARQSPARSAVIYLFIYLFIMMPYTAA